MNKEVFNRPLCDQPEKDNSDYITNQRMECRDYFHSLCVQECTFNSVFSELKKNETYQALKSLN